MYRSGFLLPRIQKCGKFIGRKIKFYDFHNHWLSFDLRMNPIVTSNLQVEMVTDLGIRKIAYRQYSNLRMGRAILGYCLKAAHFQRNTAPSANYWNS